MNFVVSIVHRVDDLAGAAELLCCLLGFQQKSLTSQVAVVENGALTIRLVTGQVELSDSVLTLELNTQDRNASLEQLLTHNGISLLEHITSFSGPERVETLLQAPFGIQIMLVQEFNEDQLDFMPSLPTALIWEDAAELCVKKMLRLIPIGFREAARVRVTERAEMLAGEKASITVTLDEALHALAKTTPLFQQPALIAALQAEGITTQNYFCEAID